MSGQTAQVVGIVTDQNGAVVPQAGITAHNTDTGLRTPAATNEAGYYIIPLLQPGNYEITVQKQGFKFITRAGIRLKVDDKLGLDFKLEVGNLAERVEVNAEAPLVNTVSGALGTVVDAERIVEIPLNGRNVLQLITLTPGAVAQSTSEQTNRASLTSSQNYSVNGGRAGFANFFVDGGEATDFSIEGPAATPPPDAVEEFSVLSNSFSAEYRGPGAVVNLITKSGANVLHGGLFEFLRNDAMDARSATALTKPILRYNQFGYSLGGPVMVPKLYNGKDRTFFFTSYQGSRIKQTSPQSTAVPSVAERKGDWSQSRARLKDPITGSPLPGNLIPASRLNAAGLLFTQKYMPAPNAGSNLATFNTSSPLDSDFFQARVDHSFNVKNRLFGRYTRVEALSLTAGTLPIEQRLRATTDNGFVINDTHTLSPNAVNEFSFDVLRVAYTTAPSRIFGWPDIGVTMPRAALDVKPAADLRIGGYFSRVAGGAYIFEPRTMKRVSDTLSLFRGRHNIRVGGTAQWQRITTRQSFLTDGAILFQGNFSGDNYADLLLGRPNQVQQQTSNEQTIRRLATAAFIQDDIHVTRKLTMNIGLRYDPFVPFTEVHDHVSAFRPGVRSSVFPNAPVGAVFSGDPGLPAGIQKSQYNLFSPRFGFAYSPVRGTAIRGGYGVFFNQSKAQVLEGLISPFQPWALKLNSFDVGNFDQPYAGRPVPFPYTPASGNAVNFFLPLTMGNIPADFRLGYVQQWNLTVERELKPNLLVSAGYIGSKGTALWLADPLNYALYIPGRSTNQNIASRRPFPEFDQIDNISSRGNSSYHSAQVTVNRRFARGLSILAHYTYGKSIDNVSAESSVGGVVSTPHPGNPRLNRGLSDFDVRQRFVASFVYRLPFFPSHRGISGKLGSGWELSGIVTLQDGRPFSVVSGTTNSLTGLSGDRADLIGDPHLQGDRTRQQQMSAWFNTAAFSTNPQGTFGTAGRNILHGPGSGNIDLGLFRNIPLRERLRLQIRGEFFNALNHANLGQPNANLSSALFGKITSTGQARVVQLAAKIVF